MSHIASVIRKLFARKEKRFRKVYNDIELLDIFITQGKLYYVDSIDWEPDELTIRCRTTKHLGKELEE